MAAAVAWSNPRESAQLFSIDLARKLADVRHVDNQILKANTHNKSKIDYECIADVLTSYAATLRSAAKPTEADILEVIKTKIIDQPAFGGLGLSSSRSPSQNEYNESLFIAESWLESLNSQERTLRKSAVGTNPSHGANPMTLAQKIFTYHAIGTVPNTGLSVGNVVRVGVDWILASELSWAQMARAYEEIGEPGIWRNDRFWLAGDHVVHPSINSQPKIKAFIESAEKAKREFRMTEYQGMNYTIMHTEFVRERAQPGMLCIGSDSHTCSAGAVGCLSIGLGAADVMMALSLGETWFKVPESILIELHGQPAPTIAGKDIILHILKHLKRNTVASERIVEFVGDGLKHLSSDSRFAIANMCTEFGAITGVFAPDEITKAYIQNRRGKSHKSDSVYFRPDMDATYAGRYTIDLTAVEPSIGVYPNPDDVVPVSEQAGTRLDGVFIGACTTTEEELVLAALVLQVGLRRNLPLAKGRRHYVPGSLPIVERLRELGLLEVYEAAGFTRGPPGCSMCVGLTAEKADSGETWLSSQNRNFKNRMGPGAFGHITSAAVCAASAFSMSITNPADLLKDIDLAFLEQYRATSHGTASAVSYVEPDLAPDTHENHGAEKEPIATTNGVESPEARTGPITSKVVRLGDFIDTDALAPGKTLTTCVTDEDFGQHVLEYTHPDFRQKVRDGQRIVVGGEAFGVGSSRECAVSALKGVGVQAVIAKSFAFIYGRNQPSLGLLGFTITDEAFYEAAQEGAEIAIDVPAREVTVGGRSFPFELSEIEHSLTLNKGVAEAFKKYGKSIWENMMTAAPRKEPEPQSDAGELSQLDKRLEW